jgi:hypothetical protein
MDVQVMRFWGMVVGAGLIALALWIAALGPETAPARAAAVDLAPATDAPAFAGPASGGVEFAQAPGAAPASFLVRFRGSGPIARAQASAAGGQLDQAQRRIEAQLRRQRGLQGLCFERFTAGAAEVVLRTCAPIAANERAAVEARWLARLRAMRGVAYVDINATAGQSRGG